ncbi:MAG TPA: hypothetical protein VE692_04795, partial [Nitrososphaera sp.]|nr:hypothetical protein [Nitrososphaera sp.]
PYLRLPPFTLLLDESVVPGNMYSYSLTHCCRTQLPCRIRGRYSQNRSKEPEKGEEHNDDDDNTEGEGSDEIRTAVWKKKKKKLLTC